MDWLALRNQVASAFGKYKYAILIVALGLFLMMLPSDAEEEPLTEPIPVTISESSMEDKLCEILGQIQDVGKVRVMITEQSGAETVYQVDEDRTEDPDGLSVRTETVILSGSGGESGLIQTVTPPTYLGAIVVCQGADSPTVRLNVANAVSAVTGISTDRISVLKMK